jgi:hypothetical protein
MAVEVILRAETNCRFGSGCADLFRTVETKPDRHATAFGRMGTIRHSQDVSD